MIGLTLCLTLQAATTGFLPPNGLSGFRPTTSRQVFLELVTRLERVEITARRHALSRLLDGIHRAIVANSNDLPTIRRQRQILLLGLGALFDPSDLLLGHPLSRPLFEGIVHPAEKRRREAVCESILIEDRADAAKHFFVSAALTAVAGPFLAERAGRDKELRDARRLGSKQPTGEGFSFLDLAYNHAGIRYATWLLGDSDRSRLEVAPPSLDRFLPRFAPLELPEGLDWDTFQVRYYGENWPEYRAIIDSIHAHLDASLPAPKPRTNDVESGPERP